jgi:iron-sulfur cluster repair protein YtfE (RIC family)
VDYESQLAELFQEEDTARHMARRLMDIARRSREEAAAERDSLLEFLRGPMERHMEYEERELFPKLEQRGLAPEVKVARKQHESVREGAARLEAMAPTDDVAQQIFDIARLLLHHTNFEGDYIYPELTAADWRELMEETIA